MGLWVVIWVFISTGPSTFLFSSGECANWWKVHFVSARAPVGGTKACMGRIFCLDTCNVQKFCTSKTILVGKLSGSGLSCTRKWPDQHASGLVTKILRENSEKRKAEPKINLVFDFIADHTLLWKVSLRSFCVWKQNLTTTDTRAELVRSKQQSNEFRVRASFEMSLQW